MTVYDIAAQLPSIEVLQQRCKALAMLDAIIGGDYYTYDRAWGADEAEGDGIDFSPADDDEVDPDGSWLLDILLDDIADKYREHAEAVYEVGLPQFAVGHVVTFLPLTDAVIRALNPDAETVSVRAKAEQFGYPLAADNLTS